MPFQTPEERAKTRCEVLTRLSHTRHRLTADLPMVEAVDAWLGTRYGIERQLSAIEFDEALAAIPGASARRLSKLNERRNDLYARAASDRALENVNREFFDAFVTRPFSGLLHSMKRTYILDELVALGILVSILDVEGAVLDIGCHVGYHAGWLAHRFGLCVAGVDRSGPAIAAARSTLADVNPTGLSFVHSTAGQFLKANDQQYDLIYNFDGPSMDEAAWKLVSSRLAPGGVLALVGEELAEVPKPSSAVLGSAARHGLLCCLADVVGGWTMDGYEGTTLLVFVKADGPLPVAPDMKDCAAAWNQSGFAAHCNAPETPRERKTQAYFRALYPQDNGLMRPIG